MTVRLTQAAVEIERHVSDDGWDQPVRLFALVDTAALVRSEPSLADTLGEEVLPGTSLTPVEQEDLPDVELDELLASIAWPDEVDGAAVVLERVMLPPDAEDELRRLEADGELHEQEAAAHVAEHPRREEIRIVVAVLREGDRECVLRLRSRDEDTEVLSGADLVPELARALAHTFD